MPNTVLRTVHEPWAVDPHYNFRRQNYPHSTEETTTWTHAVAYQGHISLVLAGDGQLPEIHAVLLQSWCLEQPQESKVNTHLLNKPITSYLQTGGLRPQDNFPFEQTLESWLDDNNQIQLGSEDFYWGNSCGSHPVWMESVYLIIWRNPRIVTAATPQNYFHAPCSWLYMLWVYVRWYRFQAMYKLLEVSWPLLLSSRSARGTEPGHAIFKSMCGLRHKSQQGIELTLSSRAEGWKVTLQLHKVLKIIYLKENIFKHLKLLCLVAPPSPI